jgi:hypothetical protein
MVSGRALPKKRRLQRQLQEESKPRSRPPTRQAGDRFGLTALQQQVGNRAVQQLLAQRQAEMKKAETPEELVETGQLKIEKPVIEEYEVNGNSLNEISKQLLSPEKWYEYEYQYKPKVENGQVTQVDITIIPTIRVPRWVGGWDQASAENKVAWLKMLKVLAGEGEKYEDMLQLLRQWLGINFEQAPPKLKGPWQGMLQERQSQEKSYMDILQRRALVLQQKMLNQPVEQLKTIFDLFQQSLKIEEAAYAQRRKFGQEQQITLSVNEMVL